MDYSQVSFNKIMLNIPTPQGEGVNFNKGEILKGLVQEVRDDGLVMLFIKGKLIEAASEVMVKSGQQLYLMVDEHRDGRTYLKVVTPQMMGEIENANLSASLREQGVASNQENVQMARKLLDYNLPVTTSNLNNLSREIKMLGGYNPRNLEIAAFALSRNIAVSPSTLSALAKFVTSGGHDVARLFNGLAQVISLLNADDSMPPATSAQTAPSDPQRSVLAGTLISPVPSDAEANVTAQSLQTKSAVSFAEAIVYSSLAERNQAAELQNSKPTVTAFSPAANSAETDINANLITNKSTVNPLDRQNIAGVRGQNNIGTTTQTAESRALLAANMAADEIIAGTDRNFKEILDLVQRLFEAMTLKADDSPGAAAQKLAAIIKSEPEVIKNLQVLGEILKNVKPEASNPVLKELTSDLISRLEGMEKEMTGQRLFNITARLPGENIINGYYFAIPVQIQNELHLCQLKIHRDAKKSLQMQANIRFIVSLDTKNLGMVLFHVDWKRTGELNLQGVVENNKTLKYLNENRDTLIRKLQALGYKVTFSGIKLARPEAMENLRPQLGEKTETPLRPFSIDVIV